MLKKLLLVGLIIHFVIALSGCGGGGSSSTTIPANTNGGSSSGGYTKYIAELNPTNYCTLTKGSTDYYTSPLIIGDDEKGKGRIVKIQFDFSSYVSKTIINACLTFNLVSTKGSFDYIGRVVYCYSTSSVTNYLYSYSRPSPYTETAIKTDDNIGVIYVDVTKAIVNKQKATFCFTLYTIAETNDDSIADYYQISSPCLKIVYK